MQADTKTMVMRLKVKPLPQQKLGEGLLGLPNPRPTTPMALANLEKFGFVRKGTMQTPLCTRALCARALAQWCWASAKVLAGCPCA